MAVNRDYSEERTLTGLFGELTRELTSLIRHEIALGKAEMGEKVTEAKSGIISLAAGAIIVHAGILVLLSAIVIGLSTIWPAWASALVVGLVVTILGVALLATGRSHLKANNLKPQRMTESLRHDRQMVREHAR
jgi:ABC-type nickel/cobalt efflux system permease component RcnA